MFTTSVNFASRSLRRINLVFFGSDAFSLVHLKALRQNQLSAIHGSSVAVDYVVTASERTPVAHFCRHCRIPFSTWPRDSSTVDSTIIPEINRRHSPTLLGLVISFGRFLPPSLVSTFPLGCINIHPSLLPRWRGPAPLLHTLVTGDSVTGITVIRLPCIAHTFDSGPVIYQRCVSLLEAQPKPATVVQLASYLAPRSLEVMFEILDNPAYLHPTWSITQQSLSKRTGITELHAPRPSSTIGSLNWRQQSAEDLIHLWRALADTPFRLHTRLTLSANRLVLVQLSPKPPMVVPIGEVGDCNEAMDPSLQEAAIMLNSIPTDFPAGGLVYLRSQCSPKHPLHPYAYIACKPSDFTYRNGRTNVGNRSWLAVPAFKLGYTDSPSNTHFRPLTALDLYNGPLNQPLTAAYQCLSSDVTSLLGRGYHLFNGFHSLPNALWPLPTPWTTKTETIQLPSALRYQFDSEVAPLSSSRGG